MSRLIFLETFLNKDDADYWIDMHLKEHRDKNLLEASVRYVNHSWVAACMFGDAQLEMDFD